MIEKLIFHPFLFRYSEQRAALQNKPSKTCVAGVLLK
jgi:hypothetical protein